MILIDKLNAFLAKFVGPNAAHMIDAGIALGIAAAVTLCASPWARAETAHHALLGALFSVGVLVGTPLASKFRKAAGSQTALVDQIAQVVDDALTKHAAVPTDATKT
jgi:hypothetical protein